MFGALKRAAIGFQHGDRLKLLPSYFFDSCDLLLDFMELHFRETELPFFLDQPPEQRKSSYYVRTVFQLMPALGKVSLDD
jgi:hypothetical protein